MSIQHPDLIRRCYRKNVLMLALALGLFASGLVAALSNIPEWRVNRIEHKVFYEEKFYQLAGKTSFSLVHENPRVDLLALIGDLPLVYQALRHGASPWLLSQGRAVTIGVSQSTFDPSRGRGRLLIVMSVKGEPWYIEWASAEASVPFATIATKDFDSFVSLLTRPVETTQPIRLIKGTKVPDRYEIENSSPPQFIFVTIAGTATQSFRNVSRREIVTAEPNLTDLALYLIKTRWQEFAAILVAIVLLLRLRDWRNSIRWKTPLLIALIILISTALIMAGTILSFIHLFGVVMVVIYRFTIVILLWIAAESFWFESAVRANPSLAILANWRLTPRGGSQVLVGSVLGLALSGIHLLEGSLQEMIPTFFPLSLSIPLQVPNFDENPLYTTALVTALVILSDALTRRFKVHPAVALAPASLFLSTYSPWGPWQFSLLFALSVAAILLIALRKTGIAGLLMASLVHNLLPLTLFASRHYQWLSLTFWMTAAALVLPLGIGAWMLSKPVETRPTRLFISYSHRNTDAVLELKRKLEELGKITIWWDRKIFPGTNWREEIDNELKQADILIVPLSPALLDSQYCNGIEIKLALKLYWQGRLRIVPIIIEPCTWHQTILAQTVQALLVTTEPDEGEPFSEQVKSWQNWESQDWRIILDGLEHVICEATQTRDGENRPMWQDCVIASVSQDDHQHPQHRTLPSPDQPQEQESND